MRHGTSFRAVRLPPMLRRKDLCLHGRRYVMFRKAFLILSASAILGAGVVVPTATLAQFPGPPPLPGPVGPPPGLGGLPPGLGGPPPRPGGSPPQLGRGGPPAVMVTLILTAKLNDIDPQVCSPMCSLASPASRSGGFANFCDKLER